MSRDQGLSGVSWRFGRREVNGLWPNQSSRGGLPFGSRIRRRKSVGPNSPTVNVIPPITTFERRTDLRAPYAPSRSRAYVLGPADLPGGRGSNCALRVGSPQIIQCLTRR